MKDQIDLLISKMKDHSEEEAFVFSDELAAIGSQEVIDKMLEVIDEADEENTHLATRTLSLIEHNESALGPLMERIHDKKYKPFQGSLVESLSGFDLSGSFVDILRIYLNGNFKSSGLAKWHLDFTEFDIAPRVLKKATKHWNHYTHNARHDQEFEEKQEEVRSILNDLHELLKND